MLRHTAISLWGSSAGGTGERVWASLYPLRSECASANCWKVVFIVIGIRHALRL